MGSNLAHEPADVFMSHNSMCRSAVLEICKSLRRHNIVPWIDTEQVRPGTWVQDSLNWALRSSRAVALILGPEGVGPWQMTELRVAIDRRIVEGTPLIPVLLPNTVEIPEELPFLRLLQQVRFDRSLSEEAPMRHLIWSITGERP